MAPKNGSGEGQTDEIKEQGVHAHVCVRCWMDCIQYIESFGIRRRILDFAGLESHKHFKVVFGRARVFLVW